MDPLVIQTYKSMKRGRSQTCLIKATRHRDGGRTCAYRQALKLSKTRNLRQKGYMHATDLPLSGET